LIEVEEEEEEVHGEERGGNNGGTVARPTTTAPDRGQAVPATRTTRGGGEHPGVARRSRSTEIATDPSASASVAHELSRKKSSDLRG
jgi:hypothetical protein